VKLHHIFENLDSDDPDSILHDLNKEAEYYGLAFKKGKSNYVKVRETDSQGNEKKYHYFKIICRKGFRDSRSKGCGAFYNFKGYADGYKLIKYDEYHNHGYMMELDGAF